MAKKSKAPKTESVAQIAPEMTRVEGDAVMFQPRTLLVPKPAYLFFEPKHAVRDPESGNADDAIEAGPHQVDPNRHVSNVPVMPNIDLCRATGNPYPNDPDHETISTKPKYRQWVKLSHAVFNVLRECFEIDPTAMLSTHEIIPDAVRASGVGAKKDGTIEKYTPYAVLDTMRDLRLYGYVVGEDASALVKKTKFRLADDWMNIQTLPEMRTARANSEKIARENFVGSFDEEPVVDVDDTESVEISAGDVSEASALLAELEGLSEAELEALTDPNIGEIGVDSDPDQPTADELAAAVIESEAAEVIAAESEMAVA